MGLQDTNSKNSAELMYIKCASCGKWMDVKPGEMNKVSHGICPACFKREMAKLKDPPPTGRPL